MLELDLWFRLYGFGGNRQNRLRKMAKEKQAMVSLLDDENMSLLLVGTGDST